MGSISLFSYLIRPSSSYYFRIIVPTDLRPVVGFREIRYSLRTGFLSEAKLKAPRMASFVQWLFQDIRKGGRMRELSQVELQAIIQEHFNAALDNIEWANITAQRPMTPDEHDEYLESWIAWFLKPGKSLARETIGRSVEPWACSWKSTALTLTETPSLTRGYAGSF